MDNDQETPAERRAMQRRRRLSARYWDAYARRTMPVWVLFIGGALIVAGIGAVAAALALR
ncbi:hypothetical protein [Pseudoclavibacter sp. Z016]|uniref:hypothetical protein n=1 Tax=Pseudoclavibacter sp. Z016 TaxID=2080581 RepID=UPI000CE767D2|nr:hypothetical protein [Pseudoclavibacter sp. Z016]PPF72596.1 hypothetical protein C5B99_17295 [Pseudoclavibacter sp. Z016]